MTCARVRYNLSLVSKSMFAHIQRALNALAGLGIFLEIKWWNHLVLSSPGEGRYSSPMGVPSEWCSSLVAKFPVYKGMPLGHNPGVRFPVTVPFRKA